MGLIHSHAPVYPRAGGGNSSTGRPFQASMGLSPHGRGKRNRAECQRNGNRSIPARAGETDIEAGTVIALEVYPRTGGGNVAK